MLLFGHLGFTLMAVEMLGVRFRTFAGMPVAWVLVGALLPDLVDKPTAFWIFPGYSTRLVGHTLVFALALFVVGWALWRAGSPRPAAQGWALAFGSFMHLALDGLLLVPGQLLWPAYGWVFPRGPPGPAAYLLDRLRDLMTDAPTLTTEVAGMVVLGVALWWRLRRRYGAAPPEAPC